MASIVLELDYLVDPALQRPQMTTVTKMPSCYPRPITGDLCTQTTEMLLVCSSMTQGFKGSRGGLLRYSRLIAVYAAYACLHRVGTVPHVLAAQCSLVTTTHTFSYLLIVDVHVGCPCIAHNRHRPTASIVQV